MAAPGRRAYLQCNGTPLRRRRGFEGVFMMFEDRIDAGRRLAGALLHLKDTRPVVLALPRGGVPVAAEIARALSAPLDLVLVRKIGAPFQPELAIGAIAEAGAGEAAAPELVTDPDLIRQLGVPEDYVEETRQEALVEIARRQDLYRGGRTPPDLAGRTVILVDDGIASGATMRAALRAVRRRKPGRLVLAVPVAPRDSLNELGKEADEILCLSVPRDFYAVGQFYRDFRQTGDSEVTALLDSANAAHRAAR
jgi:predicted phosphoribosyltransferase